MGILSKLWSFIKKWWWVILAILVVIFIWFPGTWALLASCWTSIWVSWSAFGFWKGLALGFGVLALVDGEAAAGIVKAVGENVATVASATGDALTSVAGSLLSSPLLLIGGGLLLWFLLTHKKKEEPEAGGAPQGENVYD